MAGWVIQLLIVGGALAGQSSGVVSYVKTLPPMPDQSAIVCHDANWEQAELSKVAGSQIHHKLAPLVTKLLAQAQSEQIPLEINVAYRSCPYQLQLRGANCGLGEYNLYQKPSELCTPPTEPAGKSLHNEGLAIDFACTSYSSFDNTPCHTWLKQHAGSYHLYNRALESWHWSTTGK